MFHQPTYPMALLGPGYGNLPACQEADHSLSQLLGYK